VKRRACSAVAVAAFIAAAASAAPLVVGVQTHSGYEPSRTDLAAFRTWMQRSGLTSARDEMFWWDVEKEGTFEMRRGALNAKRAWQAMPAPFSGLLTLDFGHAAYDGGGQPRTEQARAAFARYASFVVGEAGPHVRWVEVWNEWNLKTGAQPGAGASGSAREYVALADTVFRELKAAHPAIEVLVGSAGDDIPDGRWTREAIRLGLLDHADALALHLYNHCVAATAGADEMAGRLDSMHQAMVAAGKPLMPVYVTEAGWPTHRGDCAVPEATAATHSIRLLLEAGVRPWVAGVWFYEWRDGGDDAANPEHRFGLMRRDGSEKPAGCALREAGAMLAQRPFAHSAGRSVASAGFRTGASQRWAVWTRGKRGATVRIEATAGALVAVPVCGLPQPALEMRAQGQGATATLPPGAFLMFDAADGAAVTVTEFR
jgi:hypothetical protein